MVIWLSATYTNTRLSVGLRLRYRILWCGVLYCCSSEPLYCYHCLLNLTKFYKNSYLFLETMQFSMYCLYWIIIQTVGECFVKQIYYLSNTYFYLGMSCDVVSYWAIKLTPSLPHFLDECSGLFESN